MKKLFLAIALVTVSVNALADQSCKDLVHSRTMAPVKEMVSNGVDKNGFVNVARNQGEFYTYYQCDGKGKYRQFLGHDLGWSIWRTGNEWNAVHWMQW